MMWNLRLLVSNVWSQPCMVHDGSTDILAVNGLLLFFHRAHSSPDTALLRRRQCTCSRYAYSYRQSNSKKKKYKQRHFGFTGSQEWTKAQKCYGEKKRNIIMLKAVAGNFNKNLLFVVFAETVTTYTQLYTRRIEIRFLHLIVLIPIYNIWELQFFW